MTKIQKTIIAVLSVLAVGLLISVGYIGRQVYQNWASRPLGASIPTSPYTPIPLPTAWKVLPYTPMSEPTLSPLCGGPRIMNILLIGSDTRGTDYTYGLSDVMRVVRVDFVKPSVTMLDFPRDLWVEIPYISSHLGGQDHEKLNQAYLYGNPGDGFHYWDDPSAGPGLLALTLNVNFGVNVDHYLAVNMKTFVKMVDAVGGLDVTFDKPVALSHNPNLQAGLHHLDGTLALEVARDRVDGVFSRGDYQNIILCALQKKLTNPGVVTEMPDLINAFQNSVQTDLSPQVMAQLACLGPQLPRENIALYNFPESLFTGSRIYDPVFPEQKKGVFYWKVDFNILRDYVADFQAGSWPDDSTSTGTPSSPSTTTSLPMNNIPPLSTAWLLKKYGLRADKRLGQNYLQDAGALEKIVEAAEIQRTDTVLEIGPGLGSLTRYLSVSAHQVVAVELDLKLVSVLQTILKPYANIRLIHGDILKLTPKELGLPDDYLVAANIPYNITSAIIRHLLESQPKPRRIVLTVQKEVAERICATPPDMSLLALSVQVYGTPRIMAHIPAGAFYPVPKVDSAVVRIDILPSPAIETHLHDDFFQLIKAGFGQKRKTLRNSLSAGLKISTVEAEVLLTKVEIDFKTQSRNIELE